MSEKPRVAMILCLLVPVLAACGGHTIKGSVKLHSSDSILNKPDLGCFGYQGYEDMMPGTAVIVKDDGGKILATGKLEKGSLDGADCVLPFTVAVPDAKFYQVEVSHRGAQTYSQDDLSKRGWTVSLTLG